MQFSATALICAKASAVLPTVVLQQQIASWHYYESSFDLADTWKVFKDPQGLSSTLVNHYSRQWGGTGPHWSYTLGPSNQLWWQNKLEAGGGLEGRARLWQQPGGRQGRCVAEVGIERKRKRWGVWWGEGMKPERQSCSWSCPMTGDGGGVQDHYPPWREGTESNFSLSPLPCMEPGTEGDLDICLLTKIR